MPVESVTLTVVPARLVRGWTTSAFAEPVARCDPFEVAIDSAATGPFATPAAEKVARAGAGAADTYASPVTWGVPGDGQVALIKPVQYGGTVTGFQVVPPSIVFWNNPPPVPCGSE